MKTRLRLTLPVALILGAGCASLASRAPLVTPEMAAAAAPGADIDALKRGRNLYTTSCTRCHGPIAVSRHTAEQWETILPRMAQLTKLEAGDTADLSAYIDAVLAVAVPDL